MNKANILQQPLVEKIVFMEIDLTGLESERLRFRRLKESDFDTWLQFFQDPESWKYLHLSDNPDPVVQCRAWFDRTFKRYRVKRGGMHVLIQKETGDFIGQCGLMLRTLDQTEEIEVGYSVMPHFQRQGYAIEAAQETRNWAFQNYDCDSVISMIHQANQKSIMVALHNGMTLDKETIYEDIPVHIYRIGRELWSKSMKQK